METVDLYQLAIALGLGLLVGVQRERAGEPADSTIGGARTIPLITLFGALSALLARDFGGFMPAAGVVALAALLLISNVVALGREMADPGLTTEATALVMFAVGAALMLGHTQEAVAVAGSVAVLLHWKAPLHEFADNLSEEDARAAVRLVLIALVILPALPNRTYGPYDVLNPFKIWLMVVLIVGISLVAYIAFKLLGDRVGTVLGGILGGLISSTATTVSYARNSRQAPQVSALAALVIMIASTVVFLRVILEIAVVAPGALADTAPPLVVMAAFMAVICVFAFYRVSSESGESSEQQPSTSLGAAVAFGLLYAGVLFAVAAAKEHFGHAGLYTVAFLSGLTDMDAITLSSAEMINSGRVTAETGWRLILVGALSNVLFKGAAVFALGTGELKARIATLFGITLAGGVALFLLWP